MKTVSCVMSLNPVLTVVIPVYNEAGRLEALLRDWRPVFKATEVPYRIFLMDDGSSDGSFALLQAMAAKDPTLEVYTQPNAGHGPAILKGYRLAKNVEWVFQLDSDHQLDPATFQQLWSNRDRYDLLLGQRREKQASVARRMLSFVSAALVRILYGSGVKDVNCPYRLMRGNLVQEALRNIPADSFAPNILLTAWFIRRKVRIFTTTVDPRKTDGRPSRMSGHIFWGALRSLGQTIAFRPRTGKPS